jgi:hypothetical protein
MDALTAIEQLYSNWQLIENWMWPWFCHLWLNVKNYLMNHQFYSIVAAFDNVERSEWVIKKMQQWTERGKVPLSL